ncbi:phosphoinositide-binding protein [Prunus dulcis]|uniref:Phosphoinositide-binding protein n=1 Tax=Prunus dulcis TaxID=3755 RepID=A0A4Y1R9I4_PRUDU|nr:phosphoinositide-binding protein [Prunus dulcis]
MNSFWLGFDLIDSVKQSKKILEKIGLPAKPSLRGNTWVVDASHCQECTSQFTFINRQHHCRRCGACFATAAPSKECLLRGQGSLKLTSKPEDEVLNQDRLLFTQRHDTHKAAISAANYRTDFFTILEQARDILALFLRVITQQQKTGTMSIMAFALLQKYNLQLGDELFHLSTVYIILHPGKLVHIILASHYEKRRSFNNWICYAGVFSKCPVNNNAVSKPDFSYKAPYAARSSSVNQGGRGVDGSTKSMISWFSAAIGISLLENRM